MIRKFLFLFMALSWFALSPAYGAGGFPVNRLIMHEQARAVPEFAFADETGAGLSLSDFKGKVVLVNIWATWCQPCVREMPALAEAQKALDPAEFRVLPISIDRQGAEAVRAFYDAHDIRALPVLTAKGIAIFKAIDERRLPVSLLLDKDGREVGRYVGGADWTAPDFQSVFRRLIAGS